MTPWWVRELERITSFAEAGELARLSEKDLISLEKLAEVLLSLARQEAQNRMI